ncbi:hypothetical protein GCM10009740_33970 [Terrabacter terrae]|uniref:Uncharacterized protein n=1 Tax=Terrabacter terrae TaxID=318434 RepID=A0ABP5G3Z4_9MICO
MMLVDCQTCPVRDVHCADCMVTALTAIPLRPGAEVPGPDQPRGDASGLGTVTAPLDRAERRAVSALLAAGLVTTATANAARAELAPAAPATRQRARRAV